MKQIAVVLLLCLLVLTGCARRYVITLNSGTQITTVGKPRIQDGTYVFEDAFGNQDSVPRGRVKEIAPASMANESQSRFQFNPKR